MNKGIILYKSKYGATKRYVEWLAEETGFDFIETEKTNSMELEKYDVIILGGGVYASNVAGLKFLKKNISRFDNKKVAVFAVGASPYDETAINQIRERNFKKELRDVPIFYCRGALNQDKMTFRDRTICKILYKALLKQNPKTYEPWQKAMVCAGGNNCDWIDKAYLKPLLDYVKCTE